MSTIGVGAVGAVPLVAAGAVVVGAVVVAGVGIGICYVAGKGLIAGADAIHQRCAEHAATRRGWAQARKTLYRKAIQAPAPQHKPPAPEQLKAYREQQRATINSLAASLAWFSAPISAPQPFVLPPLDEDMRVDWPKPGEKRIIDSLDLEAARERLEARHLAARRAMRDFAPGGAWAGLFSQYESVAVDLEKAGKEIDNGGFAAAADHLRHAERLLKLMETEAPDRWGRRATALTSLRDAGDKLADAALLTDQYPEIIDQFESLSQMLASAQRDFERLDFTGAAAGAQAIVQHAAVLASTPQQWRRKLLLAEIESLRREIEAHGEFDAATAQLNLLDAATARLAVDSPTDDVLDHAAEMLDQIGAWADDTLNRIETIAAGSVARMHLAAHAAAQLEEMGYTVEWSHPPESPPLPEEYWHLTGRRPAPADPAREHTFIVTLSADGNMWFDATQGYRAKECDDINDLIRGLQRRGIQGNWNPAYSAEQAAAAFREAFSRGGYIFFEEGTDDGLVYTLIKDGETSPGSTVNWAGRLDMPKVEDPHVQSYQDRARQQREETERNRTPAKLRHS